MAMSGMSMGSAAKSQGFVAVHSGAGNHAESNDTVYKLVCKQACQQAMLLLQANHSAMKAVEAAVKVLEDHPCTNAGTGSNLTLEGMVECDASAVDGQSLFFGAVGALSGVTNPVLAACKLVEDQKKGPLPFGRVRPSILVGKGAHAFCVENGLNSHGNLVTANAFKNYSRYKRKYLKAVHGEEEKRKKLKLDSSCTQEETQENIEQPPSLSMNGPNGVQDTVGAICVDSEGNVAAASSSGGIWLKSAGRLGTAAVYGAGCWAQNQVSEVKPGIACVTTGCGEHLMQTLLAKTCCDATRSSEDMVQSLSECFNNDFMKSEFLASQTEKLGGALVVRSTKTTSDNEIELSWIHSTSSMCLAYQSGDKKHPTAVMSRLDKSCIPGHSFTMGGCIAKS